MTGLSIFRFSEKCFFRACKEYQCLLFWSRAQSALHEPFSRTLILKHATPSKPKHKDYNGNCRAQIQNPAGYCISTQQFAAQLMEVSCWPPAPFSSHLVFSKMHLAFKKFHIIDELQALSTAQIRSDLPLWVDNSVVMCDKLLIR